MNVRRILTFAVSTLVLVGVGTGCSSDNVRSSLYVTEINNGEALTSDVIDYGNDRVASDDDFVYEDEVQVTIWATTRDDIVNTDAAYSNVMIESYDVRFESSEEIDGFSAGLGWFVPVRNTYDGVLTLVPASLKAKNPLMALQAGGEIQATAHITFHARETDSENELTFTTQIPVNFANWTDQ
ncbi:MAG: hypothetical protein KDA27_10335 [Candidatus Eisenbacteria bacterium]|uniref:Uncharacterized protein n=1 Tax=Eiseniibacteriota bacterium TaxID=2212470 RepID=A0A956NBY7_UNCEI|nr:hypothetical protein [Candidatus Eisenbacteria bacterium]MCB9462812.1 hypothetical protein [Candidatus Eisenbacteria bacterium]